MILRSLVPAALNLALALPVFAQPAPPAAATAAFLAADVHPAPRRSYPFFFAVQLPPDRYVVRDATLVDLIATAYALDPANVQGGPSWVARDRFDIIARLPANSAKSAQQLMLRTLLTDRFHLVLHNGSASLPAFVLTASKEKLKPSDGTGDGTCHEQDQPRQPGNTPARIIACRNISMDDFAQQLHMLAGSYLDKPVVNSTGLDGAWDFDLRWNDRGDLQKAGADGISVFDAVDKQLGLNLALETATRPVVLVDGASRQPTANAADLDKLLPSQPLPQFEVATIKPSKPDTHGDGRITADEVNFRGVPLRALVDLAWDLNESDHANIIGAPKWLEDDHFDILAKVSHESTGRPIAGDGNLPMDIYEVEEMLRALLVERFQIKAHMETRPIDAYTLIAVSPKLKPADPNVRTLCTEGPGPDGKDPRVANPMVNRLVTCRNMSMAELCDELQTVAGGYIFNPVLDATGLTGSYDFTISFSGVSRLQQVAASGSDSTPSTPNGAISLFDAINRQLGLKLEKQKRPLPVLVVDHIEEKPTEN
jgi:uncharacterized protein (TIGR03435 family)